MGFEQILMALLGQNEAGSQTNDSNSTYYDSGLVSDIFGSAGDPGGTIANMIVGYNKQKKAEEQQEKMNKMLEQQQQLEKGKFDLTKMLATQEYNERDRKRKWRNDFMTAMGGQYGGAYAGV